VLTEAEDHEERLQGDLHNGFTDEGSAEEDSEGDQEVATQEPGKIEQRVWNLLNLDQDRKMHTEARTRIAIKACF
jgi:hypothetical protein